MLYFIVLSRVDDRVELENLKTRKKVLGTLRPPDTIVFDDDGGDVNRVTRILPSGYKLTMFTNGVYSFVIDDGRTLLYDITAELVPIADIDQEVAVGSVIETE